MWIELWIFFFLSLSLSIYLFLSLYLSIHLSIYPRSLSLYIYLSLSPHLLVCVVANPLFARQNNNLKRKETKKTVVWNARQRLSSSVCQYRCCCCFTYRLPEEKSEGGRFCERYIISVCTLPLLLPLLLSARRSKFFIRFCCCLVLWKRPSAVLSERVLTSSLFLTHLSLGKGASSNLKPPNIPSKETRKRICSSRKS